MYCDSCGGMIGRDCYNPQECAEITRDMEQRAFAERADDAIWQYVRALERRIAALENASASEPPSDSEEHPQS